MIEGNVQINGIEIGRWEAENTMVTNPYGTEYLCRVEYRDGQGYPRKGEFTLTHTTGEGALILAGKVLTEAHNYLYRVLHTVTD